MTNSYIVVIPHCSDVLKCLALGVSWTAVIALNADYIMLVNWV